MKYLCESLYATRLFLKQELSVTVSVFTLAAIAIHRHRGIMYPLAKHISKLKAFGVLMIIWLIAILIALPTLLDFTLVFRFQSF